VPDISEFFEKYYDDTLIPDFVDLDHITEEVVAKVAR
jgi:hypothetical protein